MPESAYRQAIAMGFEATGVRISIADIRALHPVTDQIRTSAKYAQIVASIQEVGLVEPPIVAHDPRDTAKYILLDGHLRLDVLQAMGETSVICLVSTDDEAFTYNKRVNRLAIIQEHRMILKALERGASEERIARALNVDVGSIKRKRRLLDGICPEAAELLKDKHIALNAFWELKKMVPMRQIEAAEIMIAMNKFTIGYVRSLVAATPAANLVAGRKPRSTKGLSGEQIALMEREAGNLDRELKIAEQSYGTDHLDLVLIKGYLGRLLSNAKVVRYLAQWHQEILAEFQKITDLEATGPTSA
ncbi:plasmid partitioning protein RepB C-terminal domain-containing protein [Ferrovibrio sp.]|uniref:plasmid partitioning protein RepB C-terminal domain-containing protein n=1 Tax=Ferrovibrio sp. TaxID=1917215 RepID=UPI000CB60695|nr:plasmid partitioning protein RepB C-terminal domain-containing protein [Ferrovibrio sp.]PJI42241.1 MAG: chromosome partitioning protein ParB [Ferrovibrio sp.]